METLETKIAMIVTEFGGNWTPWAERFRGDAGSVVVVSQFYGEPAASFATRVQERVAKYERTGSRLCRAVLVSNGHTDKETMSARSRTIHAIAEGMSQAGGRVLLGHKDRDDHPSLVALAHRIQPMLRSKGVSVHHAPIDAAQLPQVA